MVDLLKLFEEITRHVCGSKYPTLNLVYPYIRILKNKFALISENGESLESWIDLIYGLEDPDTNDDSSLSSNNEADIPSAGNRQQWQYTHRSVHRQKKYLPAVNCSGFLEKARAVIFLSLDELWNLSNEMGLKALLLDPQAIKLLSFATIQERKETEDKIRAELLLLENQLTISNNNEEVEENLVPTNEDPQDSLSAELWGLCSMPNKDVTVDEFTRYMKEQGMVNKCRRYKN
ncbi:3157_t:CDS:2 [Dentiscutata erythropus]|uniref:3157_t:CDS:1 n=1 Tax=Dentiscutata erythropus TaxID=1348616 RepID=A0A9N9BDZ9_9GLOM|nr:3157_t:CDS:2 [Dentiscutata erythropus]